MDKQYVEERLRNEGPKQFRYDYEVIKGSGIRTNGRMKIDYDYIFKRMNFNPSDFKGKRVLEIGTYDGALAFYLEDQGAEVLAVDVQDPSLAGFALVHELRKSTVKYEILSVYDLDPKFIGQFDCITFFGVFYHLKHPILAFERLNGVSKTGGRLFCGGALGNAFFANGSMTDGCDLREFTRENCPSGFSGNINALSELPYSGFVETEFLHDTSNWFLPNARCVQAWLKRTGFRMDSSHVSYSLVEKNPGFMYGQVGLPELAKNASRSSGHFAATCVKPPEPEFDFPGYVGKNIIPTRLEMESLEKRVADLEEELRATKKS